MVNSSTSTPTPSYTLCTLGSTCPHLGPSRSLRSSSRMIELFASPVSKQKTKQQKKKKEKREKRREREREREREEKTNKQTNKQKTKRMVVVPSASLLHRQNKTEFSLGSSSVSNLQTVLFVQQYFDLQPNSSKGSKNSYLPVFIFK